MRDNKLLVHYFIRPPYTICKQCTGVKGIEFEVVDIIANKMNITVSYHQTELENIFNDVMLKKCDLAIGGLHFNTTDLISYDYSFFYLIDKYAFAVPNAKVLSYWKRILIMFEPKLTIMYLILILMLFIWNIFQKKVIKYLLKINVSGYFLDVFKITLEQGSSLKSRVPSRKVFLIFFEVASLILIVFFKSHLTYYFSVETSGPQIKTMHDIVRSHLPIGLHFNIKNLFSNSTNLLDAYIYQNAIVCTSSWKCVDLVAQGNFITAKMVRSLQYASPRRYVDHEGKALIHIVHQSILSFVPISMIFAKDHPLFEQFLKYLWWLKDHGVVNYFINYFKNENKKAEALAQIKGLRAKNIDIQQVSGAFIALLLGWIFSCVAFVLERRNFCQKNKNTERHPKHV